MSKLPWIGRDLLRIEYDFQKKAAILYLNEGDCVDMNSAIKFVQNIDKAARTIRTISGTKEDTGYFLGTTGQWSVSRPG